MVISSVTVAVLVSSSVLVCTLQALVSTERTHRATRTHLVNDRGLDVGLDVRRRLHDRAQLRDGLSRGLGIVLRLGVVLRLGRGRGSGVRLGRSLGAHVDLCACLRGGEGVVDNLGLVDGLGGDPYTRSRHKLRLRHHLSLRDGLDIGGDLGDNGRVVLGDGGGSWDGLGLHTTSAPTALTDTSRRRLTSVIVWVTVMVSFMVSVLV
ncbi:hypothetical protein BD413DRAFT_116034 [Trametes elegans]|nr:hypothetical protein BD413DRAFT_116034 [Trametes elegans]